MRSVAGRSWRRTWQAAAVMGALAGPAGAGDWPGVGRIESTGRSDICSGTLIAPDLVLTAAHCVYRRGGGVMAPEEITFRPGGDGPARHGQRVMLHPDYSRQPAGAARLSVDLALIGLETAEGPVMPPGLAPLAGDPVTLVAYRNGRAEVVEQRGCPVLGREGALLVIACDVGGGASGGAVVMPGAFGEETVATIVARGANTAGVAYAVALDAALPALRRAWGTP